MMVLIMVFGVVMRPLRQRDTVFRQVFNLMVVAAIIQYFRLMTMYFPGLRTIITSLLFYSCLLQWKAETIRQWYSRRGGMRYAILRIGVIC